MKLNLPYRTIHPTIFQSALATVTQTEDNSQHSSFKVKWSSSVTFLSINWQKDNDHREIQSYFLCKTHRYPFGIVSHVWRIVMFEMQQLSFANWLFFFRPTISSLKWFSWFLCFNEVLSEVVSLTFKHDVRLCRRLSQFLLSFSGHDSLLHSCWHSEGVPQVHLKLKAHLSAQ